MPLLARFSAKSMASRSAVSRSTSYWLQILPTISSSGVCPSADSQMKVANSFNVNKVEVLNDATSISPSSFREAVCSLRLMKSGKQEPPTRSDSILRVGERIGGSSQEHKKQNQPPFQTSAQLSYFPL